jgi:PP-loop superfamily ATP-utilizing enzyme
MTSLQEKIKLRSLPIKQTIKAPIIEYGRFEEQDTHINIIGVHYFFGKISRCPIGLTSLYMTICFVCEREFKNLLHSNTNLKIKIQRF